MSLGDFATSTVIYDMFSTGGVVLAGTPVASVYKDGSTTQTTLGVTITASFDGVVGMNAVTVDTSADGTFYSAGSKFQIVVTTGTVNGVSIAGFVVNTFTLTATAALRPTTAARTLTVDTSGRALSDVDTIKTNAVVNGGTFTFPTNSTGASTTNITAGTITLVTTTTTATNLTNAPTAGDFTSTMKTSLNAATPSVTVSDKTGFSLAASQTFNTTGTMSGNATAAQGGAIQTKTDFLPSATAGASGGVLIAGSNATTTFANLAVTSNITVGGGLSIGTTVAIGGTLFIGGTVTFNDAINIAGNLHVISNFNVDGTATITGGLTSNITGNLSGSVGSVTAGVTVSGTVALTNGSLTTASFAAGATIPRVTLADTVTTVTGLTVANLDATVSSRAPLATALSTATWTGALATGLGVTNAQVLLIPRASGGTFIHTNVNTAETASVAIT